MRLLYFVIFLLSYSNIWCQDFYSKNFTNLDGLPSNSIRAIFKDSRGLLWIGTDAGVCKFDGTEFTVYNYQDGLAGDKVWSITEDDDANLWFGCFGGGISKFDGKQFYSFNNNDGLVDNYVRVIKYINSLDCIAIGTNKAISILSDSVFYNFSFENGSLKNRVIITSILQNDSSIVFYDFLSYHYKVTCYKNFQIRRIKDTLLSKIDVCSSFITSSNDTLFGLERMGIIDVSENSMQIFDSIGQVFGMAEDCTGDIWLASWNDGISPPGGLFKFNGNSVTRVNKYFDIESIKGWCVYYDNLQNILWYGTLDHGLYKIPLPYFEFFPASYFGENKLDIRDLEFDNNGNIWLLTDSIIIVKSGNNIKKIDTDKFIDARIKKERKNIRENNYNNEILNQNEKELILSPNYYSKLNNEFINFSALEKDKLGNFWLSSNRLGLFKIDASQKYLNFISPHIGDNFIFDESDTLILCGIWSYGVHKFPNIGESDNYYFYENNPNIPKYIKRIVRNKKDIWYCGKIEGVFLDEDGFFKNINFKDSTVSKIVNDICFDNNDNIYLVGNDGKIHILDSKTKNKIFEINHPNLNHSPDWAIVVKEKLFVGFTDGLRIYDLQKIYNDSIIEFLYFSEPEGYKAINGNNPVKDSSGNIWLGTSNGLMKINTDLIINCLPSKINTIIDNVELFNRPTNWDSISNSNPWMNIPIGELKLKAKQNYLSIYFKTLNYLNPEKDQYYYKLKGVDMAWSGPTTKQYVVYPNLQYGDYKFMVKSVNSNSGLETRVAEFDFKILTPWFKTWWFYSLFIFILIFISLIIYKYRIKTIRTKEKKKRDILSKISELETKALQSQMNPHFIFNSINSIQNFILDNEVDMALKFLSYFSKVIRMTLDHVDKKFITLSDELNYINHYMELERMRFDDIFDFELLIDKRIDLDSVLIPPMILQPFIENSIKHGITPKDDKGKIKLEFKWINNEDYICIIEDNGIGMRKSEEIRKRQKAQKTSKGIKLTSERINLLNDKFLKKYKVEIKDILDENNEPMGTRVEITLPFLLS